MSNSDKSQHGKSFQESIRHFIIDLNDSKTICELKLGKRLGYKEYSRNQFYIPYEITFADNTVWAVYSTTSMRDRFKGQLWDAHNAKCLDKRIEYACLVYPDSISEKEKRIFESKAEAIESGSYYSSIDFIASEPEFQDLLEEKAMSSAGLSNGVQGDRRGRAFERHVVNTMKHKGNLIRLKVGTTSNESGYSFALFKLITEAAGVNPSQIEAIDATNAIPSLPSGGPGKTDVVVSYQKNDGTVEKQKISCKRTLNNKVSVNQYSANEIIRILELDEKTDAARAIRMYEECGSGKALKDKYGTDGLEYVKKSIESGLNKNQLYTLTKWVVSGYGAKSSPDINCADFILIKKGVGHNCTCRIYGVEEYVNMLLDEEPLQMGTPFDWTFASGQRGKSIQFKMRTSH